jgi:ABC-2 type transport system permease protein
VSEGRLDGARHRAEGPALPARKRVAVFGHQLRSEQLLFWRSREAAFFVFVFPLLLFVLLASVYSGRIYGVPAPQALLAGMIGYGCANTAFAGLAIQLVVRREQGILKRLRATPLPAVTYVAAMLVSTIAVFALQTIALFVLGRVFYGTPLPQAAGSLVLAIVIGALVFAALGVATASFIRSAEGSSAVVNFILLPTAFLSGSFGPTRHYPAFLRAIGDVLPLKYFIEIVNAVYLRHQGIWEKPEALAVLAAWGATGLVVASLKFQWEPREG